MIDRSPALVVRCEGVALGCHAGDPAVLVIDASGTGRLATTAVCSMGTEVEARRRAGYAALDAMERHLSNRAFHVGERLTIADISLYAYTHVAAEGGFDLAGYRAIRAWLDRVAGQPGHTPITA
jgi:glutathione S-transferase